MSITSHGVYAFLVVFDAFLAGIVSIVSSSTVSYCQNEGLIEWGKAGIVGYAEDNSLIEHCDNFGLIYTGTNNSGGIAGNVIHSTINHCSNIGNVGPEPESGDYLCWSVGGIAGSLNDESTISDSTNSGDITGASCIE